MEPLDLFVASSQTGIAGATAEAAGLFTATQFSLITAAANSLLARSVATAPRSGCSRNGHLECVSANRS
jgi:hypothetical protein